MEPLQLFSFCRFPCSSLDASGDFSIQAFFFVLLLCLEHGLPHTQTGWLLWLNQDPHHLRGTRGLPIRVPKENSLLLRPFLKESSYLSGCPAVSLPGQSKVMRSPYLDGVRLFKSQSMWDVNKLNRMRKQTQNTDSNNCLNTGPQFRTFLRFLKDNSRFGVTSGSKLTEVTVGWRTGSEHKLNPLNLITVSSHTV